MFILGLIIIISLLILFFTGTYTNNQVKKDIILTENSVNNNKILLTLMNLIDAIQVNQTRLIRYAKDAIISKDELDIDRSKFKKIENESFLLIENINKLKNVYTDNIKSKIIVDKTDYVEDINMINKYANLLINKIKNELRGQIEDRHYKLTIIGDELLKLERVQ